MAKEESQKTKDLITAIKDELGGVEIPEDILAQGDEAVMRYVEQERRLEKLEKEK